MTIRALCLAALAMLAAARVVLAADQPEAVDRSALRVCSDPGNMPFSDVKGEGFENKIAELLAAKLSVPVKYTWFPQATGFLRNTLRARRCDLVIGLVSGAELALSTNPYYRSTYVMVTRKADAIAADSLDDPSLETAADRFDRRHAAGRRCGAQRPDGACPPVRSGGRHALLNRQAIR